MNLFQTIAIAFASVLYTMLSVSAYRDKEGSVKTIWWTFSFSLAIVLLLVAFIN